MDDADAELRNAAFHGDANAVRSALAAGADACAPNSKGMTPLMLAVWQADGAELVELLLDAGAAIAATQPSSGWSAATFAGVNGRSRSLALLLARGADVSADWKALHFAVQYRSRDAVPTLLTAGVPVDIRDAEARTALHRAAKNSDATLVTRLLAAGADANAVDDSGRTPLHEACEKANFANVRALVAAGADPDRTSQDDLSPRDVAMGRGRPKILAALPPAP